MGAGKMIYDFIFLEQSCKKGRKIYQLRTCLSMLMEHPGCNTESTETSIMKGKYELLAIDTMFHETQ